MVESIGFGDQLSVRMGMWRLVECSGGGRTKRVSWTKAKLSEEIQREERRDFGGG